MPLRAVNSTQFSQPARQQQQRPAPSTRAQPPRPSQALGSVARTQQQPRAVPAYGAEEDEEAEYWRDDPFEAANGEQGGLGDAQDFEEALITAEQSAREGECTHASFVRGAVLDARRQADVGRDLLNLAAMARTAPVNRPAVSQKKPQQDVRYLEDLDAVGNETSAARLPQAGLRKQGVKLKPVSSLRTSRRSYLSCAYRLRLTIFGSLGLLRVAADMFRSLWRFGVFNAVQSTCFDSVRRFTSHRRTLMYRG